MNTKETTKVASVESNTIPIAHLYDVSKPKPWVSYCGTQLKTELKGLPVHQKCVVCSEFEYK